MMNSHIVNDAIYKSPISAIMIGLTVERELFFDSAKVQEQKVCLVLSIPERPNQRKRD